MRKSFLEIIHILEPENNWGSAYNLIRKMNLKPLNIFEKNMYIDNIHKASVHWVNIFVFLQLETK